MRFGSVCSGIEAASQAWHPLGWETAFNSEIEPFPCGVLKQHYPDTPLHGDFTTIRGNEYGPIDLLVGGTPCQSFSVAGLRGGMDDHRGNLSLEFLKLVKRTGATWVVWENVPGVLSSNGGRDFGSILGGLVELGYGFAYRILDAQYFGVPQRRRRVFVIGYLGDWRPPAAVLFERQSLSGHSAPSREKREEVAGSLSSRSSGGGGLGTDFESSGGLVPDIANPLTHRMHKGINSSVDEGQTPIVEIQGNRKWPADVTSTLDSSYGKHQGQGYQHAHNGANMFVPSVVAFSASDDGRDANTQNLPNTLKAQHVNQAVAFAQNSRDELREMPIAGALSAASGMKQTTYAREGMRVRRLTPTECERLQGFPDGYTQIPWRGKEPENCPDGPRYKALGNSMAVPVMRWIGERIQKVAEIQK